MVLASTCCGKKAFFIVHNRPISQTDVLSSQHSPSKRSEERDGTCHAADQALNVLIDRRGRVEVYIPACEQSHQTKR
jgi:hypothetical protein